MAPHHIPTEEIAENAACRDHRLQKIAESRGIVRHLDAECLAWSLPKGEEDPRNKSRWVRINMLGLCSPGATLFEPSGFDLPAADCKLTRFTATLETRCVRDIKRDFSWKIYNVSCNPNTNAIAHYVRVQFADGARDRAFEALAKLLDSISVNRHVRLNVEPFGMSDIPSGAPEAADKIYVITNCAKQTPYLRKVNVEFEIYMDGEWRKLDHKVDRLGFATYKSTSRKKILIADGHPDEIHFNDDAYLRFGRLTLRFGDRQERTMLDIETDEKSLVHVSHAKKTSTIYLPQTRVRTCDGKSLSTSPIRTMARLVFREKERSGTGLLRSHGKYAAAEATKVAALIQRTTKLAAKNSLRIHDETLDKDILEMSMKVVVAQKEFTVRKENVNDKSYAFKADIGAMFQDCMMYTVPCHRSKGIVLIVQSQDGEQVLRQRIENPVDLISSVTEHGFVGPKLSRVFTGCNNGDRQVYTGHGRLYYAFKYDENDASVLVDKLVSMLSALDTITLGDRNSQSRLTELSKVLARKHVRAGGKSHARSPSDASDASHVTAISLASTPDRDLKYGFDFSRESTDWALHEAPGDNEVFEAPADAGIVEAPANSVLCEMAAGVLCRAKGDFEPKELREVALGKGQVVNVEYKANYWSFVSLANGEEGWVPTSLLDLV